MADFNGDGKSDLVITDYSADTASVLLGNGNGTFQARRTYSPGNHPASVAVADFNGDGRSDLITADALGNTASVLLGNGNGTFQARQAYTTGSHPEAVVVADFNGDGKSDLVIADDSAATASVLLGNGNGSFQVRQAYTTGSGPNTVAAADFNGDGVSDFTTARPDDKTAWSVLLGNATTTTTTTTVTIECLQPMTVSLATQEDALSAQGQIDGYLDTVNRVSGTIGTVLSRFQIAAHVASSVADVSQAAEARITDADVAENTAALVRHQILQQASAAGPRTSEPTTRAGPHAATRRIQGEPTSVRKLSPSQGPHPARAWPRRALRVPSAH